MALKSGCGAVVIPRRHDVRGLHVEHRTTRHLTPEAHTRHRVVAGHVGRARGERLRVDDQ
ncbi:MAG: hypothetical protein EBV77_03360 [Gemmatimonadaceae bacterium]|nr:hypothetical protein [Gemmatimonadaceae bacterium]